ncbi:hypothetical protein BUALT_Bualt13G0105500 [Buddleja alternifolia]|uniref:EF-hand domain-containing protein n=1 Tax=Buddleja alternifolia TaxID=168488 RepID=A0AAV6WXD1_9LAMI|nr:hypothetical protein BUALT_Bualt13G0105500 [Buddleja alternifolia]
MSERKPIRDVGGTNRFVDTTAVSDAKLRIETGLRWEEKERRHSTSRPTMRICIINKIGELCNGFQLLMDSDKGVITFESLKKNSALLGLQEWSDNDLYGMLKEGDFDGDGALNQMEFCVLMFRLSPELMDHSQFLLDEAFQQEGFQHFNF